VNKIIGSEHCPCCQAQLESYRKRIFDARQTMTEFRFFFWQTMSAANVKKTIIEFLDWIEFGVKP